MSSKGHKSVTNFGKMTGNNFNIDLVNINAQTKFGQILFISSQDIELHQSKAITLLQKFTKIDR